MFLSALRHAARTSLDGEWTAGSSQLENKNQKSREACEVHDHSAGSSADASAVRLAQDLRSRNKQAFALDGALDEAQNEVDSEAEDVI